VKRSLCAARGAGEYWIFDPGNRSVEVHRRDSAGALVFDRSLGPDDELTAGFLPGFAVRVDKLFV
jgi:Uma2 family endonuclease